jgi:dsRNA-specific ribonuclease
MVANSRLAGAALEAGLDPYIVTSPFTARKWKPKYASDYAQPRGTEKRTLSTKILADVVEALVGGAFLDGVLEKAAACTIRLLPELSALDLTTNSAGSRPPPPADDRFSCLRSFLTYNLRDRRLLREALTHPDTATASPACRWMLVYGIKRLGYR